MRSTGANTVTPSSAAISHTFLGATVLYPEFAGIEGITGYPFVVVLVGYVFGLASDRLQLTRKNRFQDSGLLSSSVVY